MFLSCFSDVRCEVGGIGVHPLGEKPLSIPTLVLFTCECALLCPLSSIVWAYKVHCCWHGNVGHGDSQVLFSPDHHHRSIEVRSQDFNSCTPGPTWVSMEVVQTLP